MGILGIYARTSIETEGTSIDQQKNLGVNFAKTNGLEYQLYEDSGKSGFKIEDDENPFKHRKGLTKLIGDIEGKTVDKVWVYEHSRLSRNQHSSYVLFRIFEKNSVTVYENGKQFDMNNPQNKMIQGILTQIAEYERQLIVSRTTRGLHDSYNRRGRSFNFVYGYKKGGVNESGYMKWIPVKSELENVKHAFKSLLGGKPIKAITADIFKGTDKEMVARYKKLIRIFRQYAYTGYSLNTDGLEILNRFKNCEIENLSALLNKEYWLKSVPLPAEAVSIENWIKAVEKLQIAVAAYRDKLRKTDTEILTGIMGCPVCDMKYYLHNGGKYKYYRHFSNKNCKQSPKSFNVEKLNNLFDVFFFYFYLVYDDTKTLIEESQRLIKISRTELNEKIKNLETCNRKIEKQTERFQSVYEETGDAELLKLTLVKEKELNFKREANTDSITKLKRELEELNRKFDRDKTELTYHDVKAKVIDYFETMGVEDKRGALIKIIKKCQVFGKRILIDAGKVLFVFDTENEYRITDDIWERFKNDDTFRDNFLESPKLAEALKDEGGFLELTGSPNKRMLDNYFSARRLGDIRALEIPNILMKDRLASLGIDYDLTGKEKTVWFAKC